MPNTVNARAGMCANVLCARPRVDKRAKVVDGGVDRKKVRTSVLRTSNATKNDYTHSPTVHDLFGSETFRISIISH